MSADICPGTMVERAVTHVLKINGKVIIVENVPAGVCDETGERFFSPATVERLQHIAWEGRTPSRVVETPVFEFVA